MNEIEKEIAKLKSHIALFPDFPKPGIMFRDLNPLYKDKNLWTLLIDTMIKKLEGFGSFDYVAGIEARGFILGSALSQKMGCGFIPVRKKGKLPGKVRSVAYNLEYGEDTLQIQNDVSLSNSRILIVDDIFATGGTLKAVVELISQVSKVKPAIAVVLDIQIADIKQLKLPYAVIIS